MKTPAALDRISPARRRALTRLLRVAFVAAVAATFVIAVMPGPEAPEGLPWDKANHFAAFYVLTGLGLVAFPRRNPLWVAAGLSAFGALIEGVQSIPFVHRDGDLFDWIADSFGIATATMPMLAVWWRRWVGENA